MSSFPNGVTINNVPADVLQHHVLNHLPPYMLLFCMFICPRIRSSAIKLLEAQIKKAKKRYGTTRHEFILELLFEAGSLPLLYWFTENWNYQRILFSLENQYLGKCLVIAARNGHLNMLSRAWDTTHHFGKELCAAAAEGGHLELIKWLTHVWYCDWDACTCAAAAGGGHFELLKWLRINYCPWDSYTCNNAARGGHLTILQWARLNGCPWNRKQCLSKAMAENRTAVSNWIEEQED